MLVLILISIGLSRRPGVGGDYGHGEHVFTLVRHSRFQITSSSNAIVLTLLRKIFGTGFITSFKVIDRFSS